jgi:hypothetical protein
MRMCIWLCLVLLCTSSASAGALILNRDCGRWQRQPGQRIYVSPYPPYQIVVPVSPPRTKYIYDGVEKLPIEATVYGTQRDWIWDEVDEKWLETDDTVRGKFTAYWHPKVKSYVFRTWDGRLHWYSY